MKKFLFLAVAIASVAFVACSKDDSSDGSMSNGCKCTYTGPATVDYTYTAEEMSAMTVGTSVSSCSEYGEWATSLSDGTGVTITCTSL